MHSRNGTLVLAALVAGCAATTAPPAPPNPDTAQITVLYDAFGRSSAMKKDWGFAALIEYGGKRILFDTGNNAEIFAHNVKASTSRSSISWWCRTAMATTPAA
jgi:7,8-dihydropterin-6-yl-methyl-4-(beta-D-ribofuranosyl)aminobenzene 5'-phosphate synthase